MVRNINFEKRVVESSNMETEEFAEELNARLNAVKRNVTNLETGTEIRGRVIDLEPNKEVINFVKNSIHQECDSGKSIDEPKWASENLKTCDKGLKAREEGLIFLEEGVESSMKKPCDYPNEFFSCQIEEIDNAFKKYDKGQGEKICEEYGSREQLIRSLEKDNDSTGETQEGVKARNSSNSHKVGKWSRVQSIKAVSMEPLAIEIGKKKKFGCKYGREGEQL